MDCLKFAVIVPLVLPPEANELEKQLRAIAYLCTKLCT